MTGNVLSGSSSSCVLSPGEVFTEELWRDLLGAPSIVGVSPAARTLRESLPAAANSGEPLFLAGEPGSGRRLLATAIHRAGPRAASPFIVESLGSVPEALREAGLFGVRETPGLLALADQGTLYLGGLEHLNAHAQERLADLLSGGESARGARALPRIIASADVDLQDTSRRGRFRRDLAARFAAFVLEIPPLRARPEDIPLIAQHLLRRHAAAQGMPPAMLSPEALEALKDYAWPGNVGELDEELSLAATGRSLILPEHFSRRIARPGGSQAPAGGPQLREAVGELEMALISQALADTNWNKSRAARALGLSRLGLQKKIDRYEIDRRR
jgi:two-component system response regulator HupR/HoxA